MRSTIVVVPQVSIFFVTHCVMLAGHLLQLIVALSSLVIGMSDFVLGVYGERLA